jgi:S1-C subfamily serine protease
MIARSVRLAPSFSRGLRSGWVRAWVVSGLLSTAGAGCRTLGGRTETSVPEGFQNSLMELHVTRVETDRFLPWRKSQPMTQRGYGIAVGPGLLLTPEELVRNNTLIQIRRAGSAVFVPARVVLSDPRSSLALVGPVDATKLPAFAPLGVVTSIQREAVHTLVQFGAADQLQSAAGTITSIGLETIARGSAPQLTYDIVSDLRSALPGTPVLRDGRLAGLVVRIKPNSNASLTIAPDMLARFLEAHRKPPFVGPPEGGFEFAPLADPVRRRLLNVPDSDNGILVVSVRPGGTAESGLLPEDVLIAWDGFLVDNQGFYTHPRYGRLPVSHLISSSRKAGELVEAEVVRGGKPLRVKLTLQPFNEQGARIPENGRGLPDDYIVECGLVFRELTLDYLQAHGEEWLLRAESRLVWEALTQAYQQAAPGRRLVILVGVLPDPVNIGYQMLQNQIVLSVNGRPVECLTQMAREIEANGMSRLEFEGWKGASLFFDAAKRTEANERVRASYRIPALVRITEGNGTPGPVAR